MRLGSDGTTQTCQVCKPGSIPGSRSKDYPGIVIGMDRKTKGRLAEVKALAHFIEQGYECYLPFSDCSKWTSQQGKCEIHF